LDAGFFAEEDGDLAQADPDVALREAGGNPAEAGDPDGTSLRGLVEAAGMAVDRFAEAEEPTGPDITICRR